MRLHENQCKWIDPEAIMDPTKETFAHTAAGDGRSAGLSEREDEITELTLVSHHLCPYVQRAAIALTEKGVKFNRLTIDLDDKPEWFKVISPLGKVPLLKVSPWGRDDAVLFESAVICEYIEETQPGRALHPADALQRAEHRAWIEFGSSVLSDIYAIETTPDPDIFEQKRLLLADKFAKLEARLGAGPYFSGEDFSLVDAAFGPVFRYFDVFDRIVDLGVFNAKPRVGAWRRALADRPSVKAAVASDYEQRLWRFLEAQSSHMHRLMQTGGRPLMGSRHG
jgi:glutathione S-transferase